MSSDRQTPQHLFSLGGKRALITGGSSGIGFMIARGMIAAGAEVLISARKPEPLERAAAELSELGSCAFATADLSGREGVEQLAESAEELFPGGLDVLVNNAGATWGAPLDEFPDSGWDKVMDTNVRGVFQLTTRLLPQLRERASAEQPARVINVGSIDGIRPPGMESYSYSASKAAVLMLTRHLAKRLAAEGVTVNAIAPGPFESRMISFLLDDPEARRSVEATVPLGRIGRPDDVAGAAIFLASPAGAYLTGVVLPVDGGISSCG